MSSMLPRGLGARLTRNLVSVSLALLAAACSSPRSGIPRIAELYDAAAKKEARNPVIVLHGILGARLAQRSTGKTVWGAFTGEGVDPNTREGARAVALSLRPPSSAFEHEAADADVYAAGPLEALKLGLLFQVFSVEVYANILRSLGAGGYADNVILDPGSPQYDEDHFTCFTFFYDWRRDNVENAIRLGRFIESTRKRIITTGRNKVVALRDGGSPEEQAEADEIESWLDRGFRFDIVAHSMGGLLARYYLRYGATDLPADGSQPRVTWAGAQDVDRLVVVGTPSLGAMDGLRNLTEGFQPAVILPHFHQALLGTMVSIYQLMPRQRHRLFRDEQGGVVDLDLFDPDVWERNGWGLMDPASAPYLEWLEPELDPAQRREKARTYLRWCLDRAKRFHASLDSKPPSRPRTMIHLFASDTVDTLLHSKLERNGELLRPTYEDASLYGLGDGTVCRYSTIADERPPGSEKMWLDSPVPWSNVTFLADDHIGLTGNPYFTNNMLFLLLETQPPAR